MKAVLQLLLPCSFRRPRPKRHPVRRAPVPVILAVALILGGCSAATVSGGASLAKAGQTASLQMEQNATISADTMLRLRKAVAFNAGFNNASGDPNVRTFLSNVDAIRVALSSYGRMLESLSASYGALGDLASYDASGNFNSAFASLVKDSNQFLKTAGSSTQIPQAAASAVETGGGIAIGLVQARDVKQASRNIKALLLTVIPVLEDPKTRQNMILVNQQISGQISQAARVLFATGVYSYSPLLDDLGAPLNLKSIPSADTAVAGNARLKAGLLNVVTEEANAQAEQMAASYDKSLAALRALVPLHDSLENGAPLNLDTVIAITSQLQALAASLQAAKGK